MNYFKAYIRHKLLGPKAWGRSVNCVIVWSGAVGIMIGFVSAWLYGQPWIHFDHVHAYYTKGDSAIYVVGRYQVHRACDHESLGAIWRIQVITTDGRVTIYGPEPIIPDLSEGDHIYEDRIPIPNELQPHEWQVALLVTCPLAADHQTIASNPIKVIIYDDTQPHGGGL